MSKNVSKYARPVFLRPVFRPTLSVFCVWKSAAVTKKRVDGYIFLSALNPRPIYEISITSGFYLTVSFTSEDKYAMNEGWRSEELIIYYVKTVRFTVGIINKSLIIPTEGWRPTSFGPNDLDITT
jgi:hypothetical protein